MLVSKRPEESEVPATSASARVGYSADGRGYRNHPRRRPRPPHCRHPGTVISHIITVGGGHSPSQPVHRGRRPAAGCPKPSNSSMATGTRRLGSRRRGRRRGRPVAQRPGPPCAHSRPSCPWPPRDPDQTGDTQRPRRSSVDVGWGADVTDLRQVGVGGRDGDLGHRDSVRPGPIDGRVLVASGMLAVSLQREAGTVTEFFSAGGSEHLGGDVPGRQAPGPCGVVVSADHGRVHAHHQLAVVVDQVAVGAQFVQHHRQVPSPDQRRCRLYAVFQLP